MLKKNFRLQATRQQAQSCKLKAESNTVYALLLLYALGFWLLLSAFGLRL